MAESQSKAKRKEIDEYHKLEIVEILARSRESTNRRIQLASFLGASHVTILLLAYNARKVGLALIAVSLLVLYMVIDAMLKRNKVVLYCRGLQLENQYAPDPEIALLHTYYASTASRLRMFHRLSTIANLESQEERIKALRTLHYSTTGVLMPAIAILIEVGLAVVLSSLGWDMF